jgi:nucleosome-remodeling factor subunit BPTF
MIATVEERRTSSTGYSQNRLSSLLFKHKEQLKKEIARKRNLLEKELSQDISREVESLKQQAALKLGAEAAAYSRKRRAHESSAASSAVAAPPAPPSPVKSNSTNQVHVLPVFIYLPESFTLVTDLYWVSPGSFTGHK